MINSVNGAMLITINRMIMFDYLVITQPLFCYCLITEAAVQKCSLKKVFWKYAASLRENTHAEAWFQKSCKATLLKSYFGMSVLQ